jgi:hypothetical protein
VTQPLISRKQAFKTLTILVLLSLLAIGLFLWRSQTTYAVAFPLDDAWIHQTYARNLATYREWAFIPGEASAGSTAPLWTLILSTGYLLSLPNTVFSYVLGWLTLLAITWLIASNLFESSRFNSILMVGLLGLVLFEWHLIWAALSGMETLLLGLHILLVLRGLERQCEPMLLGALVGLGLWIRPDAILAAVPIAWVFLVQHESIRKSARKAAKYLGGFILLALPYLIFNYHLGGEWWPSTFYAKQVEYGITREVGFIQRFLKMGLAPLVGPGALLIPGMIVALIAYWRTSNWSRFAGFFWMVAFALVYALRLPVNYQHGRYMMPIIPALFWLGYEGVSIALRKEGYSLMDRVVKPGWILSLIVLTLVFWVKGASAYASDVAIIESEMVSTAKWIEANTDREALIAAHDIGALGYYSDRQILDLAGLISPEVIPILRDEAALARLLDEKGADYLMTFPGWYPQLTAGCEMIFTTQGIVSPSLGGENMAVYRWR